jgi:sugar lactone lactonase YvrE
VIEVIRAAAVGCGLGEGPVWSNTEGGLYWTDITAERLHHLNAISGVVATLFAAQAASF